MAIAAGPDAAEFFRNYFASFEVEDLAEEPNPTFEHDLQDCNCVMNCCTRFLPEVRLQLRVWYHRLTPQGRTAFLNAHLREASPSQVQYRLPPTAGTGSLERVCAVHFMNTLGETKKRIRAVIMDKRVAVLPEEEQQQEDLVPAKRYTKEEKRLEMLERIARGLSYRTLRYKKLMPARTVKVPCGSVCKYKCYERFTLAERERKLKDLLQLPLDKQREYLTELVCKLSAKRPRVLSTGKRLTVYYFFREGRQLHRVCKTMFLNTYDLSEKIFRGYMEEKAGGVHEICGNPKVANVAKVFHQRMVFDVDEGLDEAADRRILEEYLKGGGSDNLERAQQEEYDEISIDYGTIKQELDETEQEILPDGPPASNNGITQAESIPNSSTIHPAQLTDEIDPLSNGVVAPSTVWIKQENMEVDETHTQAVKQDTKDDMVHPEAERQRLDDPEETLEDESTSVSAPSKSTKKRPPRLLKLACGARCDVQCYKRVSNELRLKLHANLLQMSPATQRRFIGDHICVTSTDRPLSRSSCLQLFYHYFIPVESRLLKVCKLMFRSVYDLSTSYLREIIREKGADKHVVCGNPNFPLVLKKGAGYYFDYDAGMEAAEEACKCVWRCSDKISKEVTERLRSDFQNMILDERYRFLSKYVQLPLGDKKLLFRARFFLPVSSAQIEKVCWKTFLSTFKVDQSFVRNLLTEMKDATKHVKAHIAAYRMDEDHYCEIAGSIRKLSRCPNVARMYNEYLEGLTGQPIDYQQYFGEFSEQFTRTGLMLPARCPDCGFFSTAGAEKVQ